MTAEMRPAGVPPYRSVWAQVGALAGSFLAAIALGSVIGWMVQPEGEAVGALRALAQGGYLLPPDVDGQIVALTEKSSAVAEVRLLR